MIVAVGSKNPVKVKAVEKVFKRFYKDIVIRSISIDTGLPRQPIGLEIVAKGAYLRSISALEKITGSSYGVGIEAGLIKYPYSSSKYLNIQLCVITDNKGYSTIGSSAGFELPKKIVDKLINNREIELEDLMEKITGIINIGKKGGAIQYLSKNFLTREDLSIQAVTTALIPHLNKELYEMT